MLAFGLATVLSVIATWALLGIDEPPRQRPAPRHPFTEIREGARFVFGHRLLLPVFAT